MQGKAGVSKQGNVRGESSNELLVTCYYSQSRAISPRCHTAGCWAGLVLTLPPLATIYPSLYRHRTVFGNL